MFKKILIANRGEQLQGGAAAQLHGMAREACAGDFIAENQNV